MSHDARLIVHALPRTNEKEHNTHSSKPSKQPPFHRPYFFNMASNRAEESKLLDEDSAGNLSETLEGLNLTHNSNDSISLSPLSQGRSPVADESAKPSSADTEAFANNILGLDHPLAGLTAKDNNATIRVSNLPKNLPPRPPTLAQKQDRCVRKKVFRVVLFLETRRR
jgi:hypothetical protein